MILYDIIFMTLYRILIVSCDIKTYDIAYDIITYNMMQFSVILHKYCIKRYDII